MNHIYEIVVFKFKEGVSFKEQKDLMEQLNEVVKSYKGFKYREYYYSEGDNRWVDRVAWFDLISAKKAMEQFFADPHCAEVISKIDDKSVVTSHYAKVGSYGKEGVSFG